MAELKLIKMSAIKSEPVEWLWEPYIPRGAISLIQGDGGEGKTTTALALAAAVTAGKALPGGIAVAPAPVIIQNAEDSYSKKLKPMLEKCAANCDSIEIIYEDECTLSFPMNVLNRPLFARVRSCLFLILCRRTLAALTLTR